MPFMKSCCCWRSLRRASLAIAVYSLVYYCVSIGTMSHFVDEEQKFLSGKIKDPTSESYLEPSKVTRLTVGSNIALLVCSCIGVITCFIMFYGLLKDMKNLLLPWLVVMLVETIMDVGNMMYLLYEQQMDFNPITSILFTMDAFVVVLNVYCMTCVFSQYQEYQAGRGTAAFDQVDRLPAVHYTAAVQQVTTTSSMPSGRRRSTTRPAPSRYDVEEPSEVPRPPIVSVLSKPNKPSVKKHVQFPDDQASLENANVHTPAPVEEVDEEEDAEEDVQESRMISSLWMEIENELPSHSAAMTPER